MQKTPLNIILNKANIREYINHLQKVKIYEGTTVLERVGWLKEAMFSMLHSISNENDTTTAPTSNPLTMENTDDFCIANYQEPIMCYRELTSCSTK